MLASTRDQSHVDRGEGAQNLNFLVDVIQSGRIAALRKTAFTPKA